MKTKAKEKKPDGRANKKGSSDQLLLFGNNNELKQEIKPTVIDAYVLGENFQWEYKNRKKNKLVSCH